VRGVWTVEQVRDAERAVIERVGEASLMRRAAFGVAVRCAELLRSSTGAVRGRRVVLLVGAGNNGGDALWAGAFLRRRGIHVIAILLAPGRAHPEGLAALQRAGGRVLAASAGEAGRGSAGEAAPAGAASDEAARHGVATEIMDALSTADLVVDGIVGLSARGALRPGAAELVEAIEAPIVAVDLPSGVDPDTGAVDGPAVTAAATVTFGALKPVHVLAPHRCGEVRCVDIGIGGALPAPAMRVLDAAEVGAAWPVPGPDDDKYTQGVTGIAAGSATYPGAAVLATGAATLATSGMVRYAGTAADLVRARWPEVIATGAVSDAGRVQAWVVGPGLGTASEGREALRHVLASGVPVCADADAITLLASDPTLWDARDPSVPVVLTPHEREFARIAGDVGPDRVAAARRAAAKLNATVLLKGHVTVIADASGEVFVHPSTSSWAATAGSGDVLSGIIGALLAAGLDPPLAAACAAHLHGTAAELAARATGPHPAADADGSHPAARADGPALAVPGAPAPASVLLAAIPDAVRALRLEAMSRH
jgi:ADP-dependent NAD(P)H-hydrate dehydratase / NAD(P)H-hydrate epimerase